MPVLNVQKRLRELALNRAREKWMHIYRASERHGQQN